MAVPAPYETAVERPALTPRKPAERLFHFHVRCEQDLLPALVLLLVEGGESSRRHLGRGRQILAKVFQGEGFDAYLKELRGSFQRVVTRKPDASRARSREVYFLAEGFRG